MAERVERRRTPRVEVESGDVVRLELRHRVQLLDISQSGALIGCDAVLPVGTRGQLRAGLGGLPFGAEVEVKRHHVKPAAKGVAMGAVFASTDEKSLRHLEMFLQRGKNSGT